MMDRAVALVVAGFGAYLVYAFVTGALYYYIHPLYVVPTVVTGVALLALAVLGASAPRLETDHGGPSRLAVALVTVPLALGVFLPATPLGLSTAAQRGVANTPLGRVEEVPEFRVDVRPETYTIKEWVRALQADPEPSRHAGKAVRVTGFVYRDPQLPADWFVVARFVVQCCAVDAQPIGLPVRSPGDSIPPAGTWVTVAGAWEVAELRGERKAVVAPTAVTPTTRPAQPYLY